MTFLNLIRNSNKQEIKDDARYKVSMYGTLFFSLISIGMTIMNLVKQYWFMAGTTGVLALGMAIACWLSYKKKIELARIIIAIMCCIIFTVYAITGENEGFAILWILMLPLVSYLLVGLQIGFYASLYFQLFLIVLFYSPLVRYVRDYYTPTFIMRFPVLYFALFAATTYFMIQRQELYNEVRRHAYHDALTNLYNRRYFNEMTASLEKDDSAKLAVVSFDLNRLKYVNDNLGHEAGDEMICGAADLIRESFPLDDSFRMGGDEFTVISTRAPEEIQTSIMSFRKSMANWKGSLVPEINISLGVAFSTEFTEQDLNRLMQLADERMYEEKIRFYEEHHLTRRV